MVVVDSPSEIQLSANLDVLGLDLLPWMGEAGLVDLDDEGPRHNRCNRRRPRRLRASLALLGQGLPGSMANGSGVDRRRWWW